MKVRTAGRTEGGGTANTAKRPSGDPENCLNQNTPLNITVQDAQTTARKAMVVSKLNGPRTEASCFTPCS